MPSSFFRPIARRRGVHIQYHPDCRAIILSRAGKPLVRPAALPLAATGELAVRGRPTYNITWGSD